MAIVDIDTFQEYVRGSNLPTTGLVEQRRALVAAEQAVQAHCHRTIALAGDTATARVFRPDRCDLLYVDDFTECTAISNDGTAVTLDATTRQLEPLNGLDYAGNSVPYEAIRLLSGAWVVDGARATVSVTAKWGWASIPDAISEAVIELAKEVLFMREMRGGVAGFGEFGAIRVRANHDAMGLLAPFVRYDRFGIG